MSQPINEDDQARLASGDPAVSIGTKGTAIGAVKYWHEAKGYGAIACAATTPWDIWCHFAQITGQEEFRSFREGDRVEVQYVRQDHESCRFVALRARRVANGAEL